MWALLGQIVFSEAFWWIVVFKGLKKYLSHNNDNFYDIHYPPIYSSNNNAHLPRSIHPHEERDRLALCT